MNVYLFELVGKWISFIFVSLASLIGPMDVTTGSLDVVNINKDKDLIVENAVIPYTTEYEFSDKVPSTVSRTIRNGIDGLGLQDNYGNIINVLSPMTPELILKGTTEPGEYTGRMTGYGPDCAGCSTVGNVACFTRERNKHSLIYDGTNYTDTQFGEARILAADHTLFPCGTVIEVTNPNQGEPYIGIVLDTGVAMRNAWRERGEVLIDLAFDTEKNPDAFKATNNNVNYSVQRWGW